VPTMHRARGVKRRRRAPRRTRAPREHSACGYPCPCCGYVVFAGRPGSHAICPICFWEDDVVQLRFPTLEGGANTLSLIESQRNYADFGACEERFRPDVREPGEQDVRDPDWRPVAEGSDVFETGFGEGDEFVEYPSDLTSLYYWKPHYWRRSPA
jgi:hypothetical protein